MPVGLETGKPPYGGDNRVCLSGREAGAPIGKESGMPVGGGAGAPVRQGSG